LIVFKDICLEVARKYVSASNGHIVDETVGGELLNKGSQWKDIAHASAESLVFRLGGAEGYFCLEFACPRYRTSTINNHIASVG